MQSTMPSSTHFIKNYFAGGANTSKLGKNFESLTNVKNIDLKLDEVNIKIFNNKDNFSKYIKETNDRIIFRIPDEAYIIPPQSEGKKPKLKILEKKHQNVSGSVETKLWAGPSLKREWEIMLGDIYDIEYGFCISKWLQIQFTSGKRKYTILKNILEENKIVVLFGEDQDYFVQLKSWLMEEE